jgi:hypothetical protein
MSRKFFVRSMIFGFMLTLAGVASARRPASLVAAQEKVDGIFASCPQGTSTSGYRDMLTRFSPGLPARQSVAVSFSAPPRKMRDHVVLSCSGGTVHSGSGYRDMLWRFPAENGRPVFAGPVRSTTAQLAAR